MNAADMLESYELPERVGLAGVMDPWIDISLPLRSGMPHWPGDIPVNIQQKMSMAEGDVCNLRTLSMSAHTGTHMDAPLHFIRDAVAMDSMPLDATIGPARVVEIANDTTITRDELKEFRPRPGERLLFKTRNSNWWRDRCRFFMKNFVALNADAARYLVECGVRTIGVDYLSVGAYEGDGVETHQVLLGAGIWVIEGLDLSAVEPGAYDLVCLPLRIEGGDGAPARAALRRL
jgi:arylformamidase